MALTAFLSYARRNAAALESLAKDLRLLGVNVWYDTELSGGSDWWDNILAEIERRDVFVYCLSADSIDSAACQVEFAYAKSLNKFVLPVQIADELNASLLPRDLATIQKIDYRSADKASALSLARAILERGAPRTSPDKPPLRPPPPLSYLGELREQLEARNLDFEHQSSLLLRIKELTRAGRLPECRELIVKFRKRHDIYAIVAEEVDVLIGQSKPPEANHHAAASREPPVKWVKRRSTTATLSPDDLALLVSDRGLSLNPSDLSGATYATLAQKLDTGTIMRALSIEPDGDRYLYFNYSFAELPVAVDYALKRISPQK